jgi:hypothetical protein
MPIREWRDDNTGRTIRQITALPGGARLGYFRYAKQIPGGLLLAWGEHPDGNALLIDPDKGEATPVAGRIGGFIGLRETDGTLWHVTDRIVSETKLPEAVTRVIGEVPAEAPGDIASITCDGATVILTEMIQDIAKTPIPAGKDAPALWRYLNRPRTGRLWAYDLQAGTTTKLVESHEVCFNHVEASLVDPNLVRFCQDMYDGSGQRAWTVRTDGTALTKIRPQAPGECVTHEFWWAGGTLIGYTFQDRREDPTMYDLPWLEYSPMPTQLGIAHPDGREVYLSDPLNHYHSHLYVSPDGRWVCGEGTDGHCFAYAAPFSMSSPRIDFQPYATIHTPYVPFRGQGVETVFSADARWLLFNDTIDGAMQVCATREEA